MLTPNPLGIDNNVDILIHQKCSNVQEIASERACKACRWADQERLVEIRRFRAIFTHQFSSSDGSDVEMWAQCGPRPRQVLKGWAGEGSRCAIILEYIGHLSATKCCANMLNTGGDPYLRPGVAAGRIALQVCRRGARGEGGKEISDWLER